MSAIDKVVANRPGSMEISLLPFDEQERIYDKAAAELATLRAKLDEAIAWHEGDDSPHARLEAKLATLRALLKEINSENELAHLENAWSWSFSSPLQGRIDAALKDPK